MLCRSAFQRHYSDVIWSAQPKNSNNYLLSTHLNELVFLASNTETTARASKRTRHLPPTLTVLIVYMLFKNSMISILNQEDSSEELKAMTDGTKPNVNVEVSCAIILKQHVSHRIPMWSRIARPISWSLRFRVDWWFVTEAIEMGCSAIHLFLLKTRVFQVHIKCMCVMVCWGSSVCLIQCRAQSYISPQVCNHRIKSLLTIRTRDEWSCANTNELFGGQHPVESSCVWAMCFHVWSVLGRNSCDIGDRIALYSSPNSHWLDTRVFIYYGWNQTAVRKRPSSIPTSSLFLRLKETGSVVCTCREVL